MPSLADLGHHSVNCGAIPLVLAQPPQHDFADRTFLGRLSVTSDARMVVTEAITDVTADRSHVIKLRKESVVNGLCLRPCVYWPQCHCGLLESPG